MRNKNKITNLVLTAILLATSINPFNAHAPSLNEHFRMIYRGKSRQSSISGIIDIPSSKTLEAISEELTIQTNYVIRRMRECEREQIEKNKISEAEFHRKIASKDWIYGQIDYLYKAMKIPNDFYMDRGFVRALVYAESSDYPKATGKIGERGLMQITKETWGVIEKSISYNRAFESLVNLDVGIRYLIFINEQCEQFYPDWEKLSNREKKQAILAGYNWGVWSFVTKGLNSKTMPQITKDYIRLVEEKEEESREAKTKYLQSAGDKLVWKLH